MNESLEVVAPVNRARVRLAVIAYIKRYGRPPCEDTRAVILATYGAEAVDGFDEGVDLGDGVRA